MLKRLLLVLVITPTSSLTLTTIYPIFFKGQNSTKTLYFLSFTKICFFFISLSSPFSLLFFCFFSKMEGGEECSSNESGWTKYIDPSDHSSIDDDHDDDHNHHHHKHNHQNYGHGYGYKKSKDDDDDDDDDSFASDASSGPGYHQYYGHDVEEYHHHHSHNHHGSKSLSSSGKKSSKEEKEKIERNIGKGKEIILKTNKSSTGSFFKPKKGKKQN